MKQTILALALFTLLTAPAVAQQTTTATTSATSTQTTTTTGTTNPYQDALPGGPNDGRNITNESLSSIGPNYMKTPEQIEAEKRNKELENWFSANWGFLAGGFVIGVIVVGWMAASKKSAAKPTE